MSAVPPPLPPQLVSGPIKTCKFCAMTVPKAASICPHCRKRLGTHPLVRGCAGLFALLVIFAVILLVVFAVIGPLGTNSTTPSDPPKTAAEEIKRDAADFAEKSAAAKKENEAAAAWLKTPAGQVCGKHPGWEREACEAIAKRQVYVGMTTEQVRTAWGKPYKINSTIMGYGTHEQWVMHEGGSTFVYFEDGIMTSLQQSK